ncbi:hypothetical protein ACV229_25000 [Burkholderia sp. MR1-5-21]
MSYRFRERRLQARHGADRRLDDALRGFGPRKHAGNVWREPREPGARVVHVALRQSDVGQRFGGRPHGRVEPGRFLERDQIPNERMAFQPLSDGFS